MKKKAFPVIAGFLTAYAFRATINVPIKLEWYESTGEWVLANIFELLGYYDFLFLFFWFLCSIFFIYMLGRKGEVSGKTEMIKPAGGECNAVAELNQVSADSVTSRNNLSRPTTILSALFAILLPMGQSIRDLGSAFACVGSIVNAIKTIICVIGFFIFFREALTFLFDKIQKKNFLTSENDLHDYSHSACVKGDSSHKTESSANHFFSSKPFLKAFIIIFGVYALVDIICYPGNLNADTIGQIYQIYGIMPFSEHHPLVSSLLVGGLVKLGDVVFGSEAIGLFIYVLLQSAMLAAAFALTIQVLAKRKMCKQGLWIMVLIYILTPVYTNIASTAIKDVPFMGFVITYVVMLVLLIEDQQRINDTKFLVAFILVQTMAMLLRNNGFYFIAISGFVLFLMWQKKHPWKSKLRLLLGLFLGASILSNVINGAISTALDAEKVHGADALALPFQMLGGYYQQYPDDIRPEEVESIEKILGPIDKSLSRYNPELADQIKAKFVTTSTKAEAVDFIFTTVKLFFRHPLPMIDAVLVHTYGWYDPVVSAAKRYETPDDDYLTPTGLAEVIDKGMVFIYRFLNRISLLGALENVGTAMWAYLILFALQKRPELKKYRVMGIYIFTNLLICCASPAFLEHTRYGFPILMVVPFLFSFTLTKLEVKPKS